LQTATGMAMAVVFVIVMTGTITWFVYYYILRPFNLTFIRTLAFILVIAAVVQFVEMFLKKNIPALYSALGIYLPLITTNCAVLGVCFININENYNFITSLLSAFFYSVGYGLALILFAAVRERILLSPVPKPLQDVSIGLVTAGIMSLSFLAFKGMV
ncbi:MAG: electron transport complex protein RnfA, partial [Desulfatiglandales bacterium]